MNSNDFQDRTNAPIQCPLKNSVIAWARCVEYRKIHKCLCPEALERVRLKGEGREVFEQKLGEIKIEFPQRPAGWTVQRGARFYVIHDETNHVIHRATNQTECENYLLLAATAQSLQKENDQLWKLLKNELTLPDDHWDQLDQRLAAETSAPETESKIDN